MSTQQISYKNALAEVEAKLIEAAKTAAGTKYFDLQAYIGTRYQVSGLKIPEIRQLFKQGYSFSHLQETEQYLIWKYIWNNSKWHDAMTQCILFCDRYIRHAEPDYFRKEIIGWLSRIDNWAHSDGLTHYYAALLEIFPKEMYQQLKKWNSSSNPWERRQSVLSLLDYARFRKKYPTFHNILQLVTPLLKDENYFVQKGIGWCLRETGIVYPAETKQWLRKNATELSSPAFATATEKIPAAEKEKLKALRKSARSKKK